MDAFAPIPGVKSNGEPNAIPPTSKLSSTPHNDSYPDGSPTSPISLASSTHPSPIDASTPGDSSCCPSGTGQCGKHHHTNTRSCSESSGTGSSPSGSGRGTT